MESSFSACCNSFQKEKRAKGLCVILEGMPLRNFWLKICRNFNLKEDCLAHGFWSYGFSVGRRANAEAGTWRVFRGDFPEEQWYNRKFNPSLVRRSGRRRAKREDAGRSTLSQDPGGGGSLANSPSNFGTAEDLRGSSRWLQRRRLKNVVRRLVAAARVGDKKPFVFSGTAFPDCRDDNLEERGSVTPVLLFRYVIHPSLSPGAGKRRALLGDRCCADGSRSSNLGLAFEPIGHVFSSSAVVFVWDQ